MRQLTSPGYICRGLACIFLMLALSSHAVQEKISIEDGKASLLLAVLDNITWPQEERIDRFVIGLYGSDDELREVLNRETRGLKIRGKPVAVVEYDSLSRARAAQMLILPESENSNLPAIRRQLEHSATLIVTDGSADLGNIMVNFTRPSKLRLAFEINRGNIVQAGLQPSSDLLLFGGSKRDLADIYRQTESELSQAKALADRQQRQLREQQALLADQEKTIRQQHAEVAANQKELAHLEQNLANVQQTLEASEGLLEKNAEELIEKEKVLAEKEAYIESYSGKIERNLQRLEEQKKSIEQQEARIAEQNSVLMKQMSTIENQRLVLAAAVAVLLLVIALIVIIFIGYRSKHRLNLQLEGKTRELGVANEKLVQMTEAKSQFLSTMSHEIRTPMNGVIGMAELLEGTDLTDQQREYVSLIIKSADTLLGLINDILDFSKIEAGRLELEATPFNLCDILGDTLQTLALRANEKGLELTFHIPPDVPDRLVGDPLRLRQIFVNLVGNAIKFTDTGEVAVDVQLKSSDGKAACVAFEVRDTGIGISEAQQQKIFEAFGQADSSTTRQFGGTGLGLSIACQLAEMMGGRMAVTSEVGRGSTFSFSAEFGLPDEPATTPLRPAELAGLRALVVDDNSTNRMILEELLHNWGMVVDVVSGGDEALAVLDRAEREDAHIALALLDVMMPGIDGFELAARIRERPVHREMRILMLTSAGHANVEALRGSYDISRVLLKPVKHSDLLLAITEALGLARLQPEVAAAEHSGAVTPRRILLVEDNPVNQKVARELLVRRGHVVEVAGNGEEAVDRVSREAFDVVLMDVHMPVMDGLTATRIIRDSEQATGTHVPIIALTAGATVEDRENCTAAGMNGFVIKPFRAEELYREIEGLAPGPVGVPPDAQAREPTAGTGDEPTAATTGDEPTAAAEGDRPCLDWAGALRNLDGDETLLFELVEMFIEQCPALIAAVEGAISSRDADELRRAAHSLKGSAQVLGGRAAAAAALSLERLGREHDLEAAVPALDQLKVQLAELKAALSAALRARDAA